MIIRNEQMEALGRIEQEKFEAWMFEHVTEFFPDRCQELEEQGTREAIRDGIERAEQHGITDERDVVKYIDVEFALDGDIERDPAHAWARRILDDPSLENDPSEKATRLHEQAVRRLESEDREM